MKVKCSTEWFYETTSEEEMKRNFAIQRKKGRRLVSYQGSKVPLIFNSSLSIPLVTQPMIQRRPNRMELRSKDSNIQILCRFQKSKRKVPPPSLPCTKKSPFTPQRMIFSHPLWGWRVIFLLQGSDGGGTFCLLFWNLHKIWIWESNDLNSVQFGQCCIIGWVTSDFLILFQV